MEEVVDDLDGLVRLLLILLEREGSLLLWVHWC